LTFRSTARLEKRDLHDERGSRGMVVEVVTRRARHHGDVGLGLGVVVQAHRHLDTHIPRGTKGSSESPGHELGRGDV
jgi:hypothetical protein